MAERIQADLLKALDGVQHGFFTRGGGVSGDVYASLNCGFGSRDDAGNIVDNRARVARRLGTTAAMLVTPYQVHSATAVTAEGPWPQGEAPKADAVVTAMPGLAVGVLTADCVPVLFADKEAGVVAAAHAGWRGALAGVAEATIAEMARLGARHERIRAVVGPGINGDAYEVGPEFEAEFVARDGHSAGFFSRPKNGHKAKFDLPAYVAMRLVEAGVGKVEQKSPCTYVNESLFFSFRRTTHRNEADYGRQISAIVLI